VLGCAGGWPQFSQSNPLPVGTGPGAARLETDTKPFTDLRIPKVVSTDVASKDPMLVQASATAPAALPQASVPASAGPELKTQQAQPVASEDSLTRLRLLQRTAAEYYARVDSYIVRLRRREQVSGKDKPEEVILLKFRKQPFSAHLIWLKENSGREVVYVKGQHEDKIHTLLAAGDMPLMPAGKRVALPPDSILVRSASRHSIHETGFGTTIERFGAAIDAMEKGDRRLGTFHYLGLMKRAEFETPYEAVEHIIPAGLEPPLPRGGKRLTLFEPTTKFPMLIITQDDTGHEVEYYCFDRLQYPVRLDDEDFDPDKLWPASRPRSPQPENPPSKSGGNPLLRPYW
jgi:hypothetical protein